MKQIKIFAVLTIAVALMAGCSNGVLVMKPIDGLDNDIALGTTGPSIQSIKYEAVNDMTASTFVFSSEKVNVASGSQTFTEKDNSASNELYSEFTEVNFKSALDTAKTKFNLPKNVSEELHSEESRKLLKYTLTNDKISSTEYLMVVLTEEKVLFVENIVMDSTKYLEEIEILETKLIDAVKTFKLVKEPAIMSPESTVVKENPNKGKGFMYQSVGKSGLKLIVKDSFQVNKEGNGTVLYKNTTTNASVNAVTLGNINQELAKKNLTQVGLEKNLILNSGKLANLKLSSISVSEGTYAGVIQCLTEGTYTEGDEERYLMAMFLVSKEDVSSVVYTSKEPLDTKELSDDFALLSDTQISENKAYKKLEQVGLNEKVSDTFIKPNFMNTGAVGSISSPSTEYILELYGNNSKLSNGNVVKDLFAKGIDWKVYFPFSFNNKVSSITEGSTTVSYGADKDATKLELSYSIMDLGKPAQGSKFSEEDLYGFTSISKSIYDPYTTAIDNNKYKVLSEDKFVDETFWMQEISYESRDRIDGTKFVQTINIVIEKKENNQCKVSILSNSDKADKPMIEKFKTAFENSVR